MRPIRGFERPVTQYVFVALAVVLIAIAAWGAASVRRASREIERLRARDLDARVERDQLEARAAREQAARESLSFELSRARSGAAAASAAIPTLTLAPLTSRGAVPPPPTVAPPPPTQVIALRLVLPRRSDKKTVYQVSIRRWSGGQTIWSRGELPATVVDGRALVETNVTGDVFAAGSYEALLTGTGDDGTQTEITSYEVTVGR